MSEPPGPYVAFESQFLMGIEALDNQHKQLVDLVNELHQSLLANEPNGTHVEIMTRMVNLAKTHFLDEEHLCRVHGYPRYLFHKSAHEGLMRNLTAYRDQVAEKITPLTAGYVELMKLWIIEHFFQFDQPFAKFVQDRQPASKVTPPPKNP
jgi:hemerythrin